MCIYMDVDVTLAIETQIIIFYGTTYNKHTYGYSIIFSHFLINDHLLQ